MSSEHSTSGVGHLSAAMTATIMVVAVIVVFLLFIFALFLFLHAKKYWGANPAFNNGRQLQRFVFAAEPTAAAVPRRGLDPAGIKALSSFPFRPENFKDGLECAVCLSELLEGEEARLLPRCEHAFHVECIDVWFQSHSTCPLCRSPVLVSDSVKNADSGDEVIEAHHATEVISVESATNLFTEVAEVLTGDSAMPEGSSSSSVSSPQLKATGMWVVEIQRRMMDRFSSSASPLPLSSNPAEEVRSPSMLRLQSLRRILRGVGSPRSPRSSNVDIEQGANSIPKTPTTS